MFALPLRRAVVMVMYVMKRVHNVWPRDMDTGGRRCSSFAPTMIINYTAKAVVVHARALDFGQNRNVSPRIM